MNFNEILYGVAYYDEYMPYDRIETDFKMIRDAGMNVIRIAESTWSTWEPEEGVFDFTHLHRMLDCAAKYELNVIVEHLHMLFHHACKISRYSRCNT